MPLLRGFSIVDPITGSDPKGIDAGGKILIPSNIQGTIGLNPGSHLGIKAVRIKESGRCPYLIVYHLHITPKLSQFEVVVMEDIGIIDEYNNIFLTKQILEEAKLEADFRVEIKVVGPGNASWAVIRNRGSVKLSTLQKKIGRLGQPEKKWKGGKWKSMTIDY